eukprot:scaffold6521_cov93-Cylindrotheca_fusiformis.AAC.1
MSASVGSIGSQPGNAPGANVAPTGGATGAATATGANVAPTAGATGAAVAPGANVAPTAPVGNVAFPTFSLAPANSNTQILDYDTKHGAEIFKANTKPFGELYDLDPQQLGEFITTVEQRSTRASWTANFQVPTNGGTFDFFENYGRVSLADCQAFARTYVGQRGATEPIGSELLPNCGMLGRFSHDGGGPTESQSQQGEVHVPQATRWAVFPEEQMQNLNTMMVRVDNDVIKFNTEVTNLKHALLARRETPVDSDMVLNLFHGYRAAGDRTFLAYINKQFDEYVDGDTNFTAVQLMAKADNKYKQLVKEDLWMHPSAEQQQIVALTAALAGMRDNPKNSGKGKQREYAAWKLQAPKESEPKVKQHSGRTYYWCPHHKLWTAHKPADCTRGGTAPTPDPPRTVRSLQATTLAALVAGMDESESWSE